MNTPISQYVKKKGTTSNGSASSSPISQYIKKPQPLHTSYEAQEGIGELDMVLDSDTSVSDDPRLMNKTYQSDTENWWNSLMNSIDEIHKSSYQGKTIGFETEKAKLRDEMRKINREVQDEPTRMQLIKDKERELEKIESDPEYVKLKAKIQEQEDDIADTPVDAAFAAESEDATLEENTSVYKYLTRELPQELGGSLSEVGWQIGATALTAGGKQLAKKTAKWITTRAAASASGGIAAPIIAGSIIAGEFAAGVGMLLQMRDMESEAEKNDAFQAMVQKELSKYGPIDPNTEEGQALMDKAMLTAQEGLDQVYAQNMALSAGDIAEVMMVSLPWLKAGKAFSRLGRAGRTVAGGIATGYSEGMEETDQYAIRQQYLAGKYKDNASFLDIAKESAMLRKDSFDYAFGDETTGEGYEKDAEYRNAFRSGAILGGMFGGAGSLYNLRKDEKTFADTKKYLEQAKPFEVGRDKDIFRAHAYGRFFPADKGEFLIEGLQNLRKGAKDPEHAAEIEKEIALAKKAQKTYDDIEKLYRYGSKEDQVEAFQKHINATTQLERLREVDGKLGALFSDEEIKMLDESNPNTASLIKAKAELKALDNILTQYLAIDEDDKPSTIKKYEEYLKPIYEEKLAAYREGLAKSNVKEEELNYTGYANLVKLYENKQNNQSLEREHKDTLAMIANPKMFYDRKKANKNVQSSKPMDIRKATTEEYVAYEKNRIAKQRIADNYENAKLEKYGEYISDRLGKENLETVLDGIAERALGVSDETDKTIQSKIEEFNKQKEKEKARLDELNDKEQAVLMGFNEFEEGEVDEWNELKNKDYSAVDNSIAKYSEFKKTTKAKSGPATENGLRRQIKNKFFVGTEAVKDKFSKNDDYVNLNEVNHQLEVLNNLRKIAESREDEVKNAAEFSDIIQTIDDQITELQKIKGTVEQRLADIKGKDAKILANHAEMQLAEIGLDRDANVIPDKQELNDAIKQMLGKRYDDILAEAKTKGLTYIYPAIIREMAKNNDAKTQLADVITRTKETIYNKFINLPLVRKDYAYKNVIEFYKNNPDQNITHFLKTAKDQGFDNEKTSALYNYLKERDIVTFLEEVKVQDRGNSTTTAADLEALVSTHLQYSSLISFEKEINNPDFKLIEEVATERDLEMKASKKDADRFAPTPSNQQLIAIRQIVKFFKQPIKGSELFDGWAYLRGYAGTGKTNVVIRWAVKLLGLQPNEIYAASYSTKAAEHITKSLGLGSVNTVETLIDDLNNGKIAEDIKLIVIDEAGGITNRNLEAITVGITKLNAKRKTPLKVIAMGDPNQITSEGFYAPIDTVNERTQRLVQISPLTIRFRSNVSAIVDIQDLFIDQSKDMTSTPVYASSNTMTPETHTGDLVGVNGGNFDQNIIALLSNRPKDNKRRAIIVANEAEVKRYKDMLAAAGITSVEVMTYQQSQGDTIGEVYVNIPKDNTFASNNDYNKAIYTALSRATDYIYLGYIPVNNNLSIAIKDNADQREADNKQRSKDFVAARNEEFDVISKLYAEIVDDTTKPATTKEKKQQPSKPEPEVQVDEEDIIEEEEEAEAGEQPPTTHNPVDVPKGQHEHTLLFSSSNSIERELKNGDKIDGVKPGSEVIYVKTKNTKGHNRIEVIHKKANGEWIQVGVIGQDEVKTLPKHIQNALAADGGFSNVKTGVINPIDTGIVTSANLIKYNYGKTVADNRPLNFVNVVTKFINTFFDVARPSDAKERAIRDASKVVIFDRKTRAAFMSTQKDLDPTKADGLFVPEVGIPYLQLSNLGDGARDQFIRLSPSKLNLNKHKQYAKIVDYAKLGVEFKQHMGIKTEDHKLYSTLIRRQDKFDEYLAARTGIDATEANRLRKEIRDLMYVEHTTEVSDSEKKMIQQGHTVISTDGTFDKQRKVLMIDGTDAILKVNKNEIRVPLANLERVSTTTLSDGPVQKAFDAIAKSNLSINGHLLRQQVEFEEYDQRSKQKVTKKRIQGKKLLIARDFTVGHLDVRTQFGKKVARRAGAAGEIMTDAQIELAKEQMMAPITPELLLEIFATDANGTSTAEGGFGIRVPITKGMFGGTKLSSIASDMLEESFEGVTPTRITVSMGARKEESASAAPASTPTETNVPSAEDTLSELDQFDFYEREGSAEDLGSLIVGNRKVYKYMKGLIPNLSREQVQLLLEAQMLKVTKGVKAWGMVKKGIAYLETNAQGGVFEDVIRHEAFHIVTNYNLTPEERQKLDAIARRDYPELRNATPKEVREFLARKYQGWRTMRHPISIALVRIFNKIASALGFYRTNFATIDQLFEKVEEGAFTKASSQPITKREFYIKIKEVYSSTANYTMARNMITTRLSQYMYPSSKKIDENNPHIDAFPRTFLEAKDYLRTVLLNELPLLRSKVDNGTANEKDIQRYEVWSTLMKESRTKDDKIIYKNYDNMVSDIFPNSKNVELGFDTLEEQAEYYEAATGINDYISDSDSKSADHGMSRAAKDLLSTIFVKNESTGLLSPVPFKTAFSILLKVMGGTDSSDFGVFEEQITKRFGKVTDPTRRAILNRVKELIYAVDPTTITESGDVLPTNMEFTHTNRFLYTPKGIGTARPYKREAGESSKDFFTRIKDSVYKEYGEVVSYGLLRDIYKRYDYGNKLASIYSALASYREKNVRIGYMTRLGTTFDPITRGVRKISGYLAYRLAGIGETGAEAILRSEVEDTLHNNAEKFNKKYVAETKDFAPVKYIRHFFKTVGFKEDMHIPNEIALYEALKGMIDSIAHVIANPDTKEVMDEETGEMVQVKRTPSDVIVDQHNRIDPLVEVLMFEYPDVRNQSYMSADGKKRQNNILNSSAIDTIMHLTDQYLNKSKPKFLTNEFYAKYNPFLNKKSEILRVIDYDGLKDEEDKTRPVLYADETESDWFVRSLNASFVSMIRNASSTKGLRYIQYFYTISNKPQAIGAEIALKSNEEIKGLIQDAFAQEKLRKNSILRIMGYKNTKSFLPGKDVDSVMKHLEGIAEAMANRMVELQIPFDYNINEAYSKLNAENMLNDKYKDYKVAKGFTSTKWNDEKKAYDYTVKKEDVLPMIDLYVKNQYMNGIFLNQLVMGDQAFYKSTEDQIKRMSISFGMGHRLMVNGAAGFLKDTFRVAVAKETPTMLDDTFKEFSKIIKRELDFTDGFALALPSHAERIRKSAPALNLGPLMKPVHFEVDANGIPRAMKYAVIELTDAFLYENGVLRFPELLKIRQQMEASQVDQLVFASGFKVGAPLEDDQYDSLSAGEIPQSSIVEMQSRYLRIQQNPMHDLDSPTANPSQLTFFVNLNGNNKEAADRIFELNSKLIDRGLKKAIDKITFREKGSTLATFSAKKIRLAVLRNLKGESDRIQAEMLNSKNAGGNHHISINFPTLVNKVIVSLASSISKSAIQINFPGSKLVLQADYKVINPKTGEPLKWRNEEGYAEVILPNLYQEWFKEGDMVMDKMVGFRIPSTELHSAIPLKVVGFYDDKKTNAVIAPKEIVLFHGSDYDIDALFIIRKEVWKKDDIPGFAKQGDIVDFGRIALDDIEKKLKDLLTTMSSADSTQSEKDSAKEQHKLLDEVYELAIKNEITDTFLETIKDKKNDESMMTPITTYRIDGRDDSGNFAEGTIFRMLQDKLGDKFKQALDLNNVMHQAKIHGFNHGGSKLVGFTADAVKGFSYILQAAQGAVKLMEPRYNKEIAIQFNGVKYDKLSRVELVADENGNVVQNQNFLVSEIWDSVINAALDNVKLQALPEINFTNMTSSAYMGAIAMGIPIEGLVRQNLTPAVKLISTFRTSKKAKTAAYDAVEAAMQAKLDEAKKSKPDIDKVIGENDSLPSITFTYFKREYASEQEAFEGYMAEYDPNNQAPAELVQKVQKQIEREYKKALKAQGYTFAGKADAELNQIIEEAKEIELTDAMLDEIWHKESVADLTLDELKIQYAALENFYAAEMVGEAITDNAKFLKILKQLPVTEEEIRDKQENYEKITTKSVFRNEDGSMVDVSTLPHIKSAKSVLDTLDNIVSSMFHKHDPRMREFAKKIKELTGARFDFNDNKNLRMIRDEFVKYVMSGVAFSSGEINMDTSKEPPYKREGRKYEVVGADAWNQRFIMERVKVAKKTHPSNKFLKALEVRLSKDTGLFYLRFSSASNMAPADFYDFQDDFNELANEDGSFSPLQYDLVKYAALNFGLSFGSSNYSLILPPAIYSKLSTRIDNEFEKILADEESLNKMKHHFAMLMGFNYSSELGTKRNPKLVNDKAYGVDVVAGKVVRYDLKYDYEKKGDYPLIIRHFEDSYIKLQPIEGIQDKFVYYQRIGKEPVSKYYQFNQTVAREGYDYRKVFRPSIIVRRVLDNTIPTYEGSKDLLKVGDTLALANRSDITRVNMIDYTVESITEGKDGKVIYNLSNPIPVDSRGYFNEEPAKDEQDRKEEISDKFEDDNSQEICTIV